MRDFLRKLGIRTKLLLGFGVLALLLLILGVQQYLVIRQYEANQNLVVNNLVTQEAIVQARYLVRSDMETVAKIIMAEGPNELENLIERHENYRESLKQVLKGAKDFAREKSNKGFASQKNEILQIVLDAEENYENVILPAIDNVISLKTELMERPEEAAPLTTEAPRADTTQTFNQAMAAQQQQAYENESLQNQIKSQTNYVLTSSDRIINRLSEAEEINQLIEFEAQKRTSDLLSDSRLRTIIIILAGVSLAVVIALLIASLISQPISYLRSMIEKLGKGELPDKIQLDVRDEIGHIAKALDNMVQGLKNTSVFAQAIGRGDFSTDYQPLSKQDVLGNSLIEMQESLKSAKKEEEKRLLEDKRRTWTTEGISRFNEILQQHNDNLSELANEVTINIVKYLEANQAGLFVVESDQESTEYLELKASYAFNRRKFLERKVKPSEGLVGMCFVEKYTYHLTDVPEEYVEIESGLGDANPKNILIVPMIVDDKAYGVLEIASFKSFQPHEIRLVERVANNVASSISTLKINARTAELLKQSQRQAQEMHDQEEEMRQNMEEMQATQEESLRREEQLKKEIAEMEEQVKEFSKLEEKKNLEIKRLNKTNEQRLTEIAERERLSRNILESSLDGVLIIDESGTLEFFNAAAERLFGYSQDEVVGKSINYLMPQRHSNHHDDYINRYIKTGIKKIIGMGREVPILRKDGVEANVHLSVVETTIGGKQKFTGFMRDLTKEKAHMEKRNILMKKLMTNEIVLSDRLHQAEKQLRENDLSLSVSAATQQQLINPQVLQLGLKTIDKEHEKWIALANRLYSVVMQQNDTTQKQFEDLLREFEEYTQFHFDNEEFYLKKFNFEETQDHTDRHSIFFSQFNQYRQELTIEEFETVYNLLMYVRNWLIDHINKEDRKFVELLKANNIN